VKCDCEHEASGIICGHRPGACDQPATRKVHLFGLAMNCCDHCFEMQHAPIPLEEKLEFDWYLPVDLPVLAIDGPRPFVQGVDWGKEPARVRAVREAAEARRHGGD